MKLRLTILIASLLIYFGGFTQSIDSNYVDGVIYVKVYDTSSMDLQLYSNGNVQLDQLINDHAITNMFRPFKTNTVQIQKIFKVEFDNWLGIDTLINGFNALPFIEYAEKAPIYHINYIPDDYDISELWHLDKIKADKAWNGSTGSSSVTVAIVDNAIALHHEDLETNIWTNTDEIPNNGLDDDLNGYVDDMNGYDVADGDSDPSPPASATNTETFIHGTHVAGITSASTNNSIGISSLGYSLSLMPVKCTENSASGNSLAYAYEGVDYAIANNADIINMSFGSAETFTTWDVLVQTAQAKDIFMVAAAGNGDTSELHYPAAYPYVFAVGATDLYDKKASFSNFGNWVDVMAPGLAIKSTLIEGDNTYGPLSGTSMAAPLVSALGGLIWSVDPNLGVQDLKDNIKAGCLDIDSINTNYQGQLGAGRINAFESLSLLFPAAIHETPFDKNSDLHVFPNPANNAVHIITTETGKKSIEIYSSSGVLIQKIDSAQLNTEVDVSHFSKGVYLIKIKGQNGIYRKKLLVN